MHPLPQPAPEPVPVAPPADVPFPGRIRLHVDARDLERRIFRVRETIPVERSGTITLLFPEWLPGYHAPQAPIELFAGLKIEADGMDLPWKRHPVNVHGFSVEVPEHVSEIAATFQFLSPTDPEQGRVVVGAALLILQWNTVLLYPAGHFARQIDFEASLELPSDFELGCALDVAESSDGITRFEPVSLDVLVDSPVLAGRHFCRVALDDSGEVHLNMAGDDVALLAAEPEQIARHSALVEQTLGALALTASTYAVRAGSRWRPMSDTTRDPIIAARAPLPWASWQRSEDYYSEGALVWLDVDTRIRELTAEERSFDDFAVRFFGTGEAGDWSTETYGFEDVIACLSGIAAFDWAGFFVKRLEGKHEGAPLAGIERGGYALVYRDTPSEYWANTEKIAGNLNLTFSLGLAVNAAGKLQDVLWEGSAFDGGLTAGSTLLQVNGTDFTLDTLRDAVAKKRPMQLRVRSGTHERMVELECTGHHYPHLEPRTGARRRLDDILQPRTLRNNDA
jgi:predicted metalloprotease with PDZ domain